MDLVNELVECGLIKRTDSLCEAFYSAGIQANKTDDDSEEGSDENNFVGSQVPEGGEYTGPQDDADRKLIAELSFTSALAMMSAKNLVSSILSYCGGKLTDQMKKNLSEISSRMDNDSDYMTMIKNEFLGKGTGDAEREHQDDGKNSDRSDHKGMAPDIKDDVAGIDAMIQ
jgi:hypothetical protein